MEESERRFLNPLIDNFLVVLDNIRTNLYNL
jgi:hypothetical protein